jgi:PEGA domain-containing protein
MKRRYISSLALALAVTGVSWQSAAAQDRTSNGNTTGSAVPRGGGDGGGSATSGGSSGGSSSGSSSSGSGSSMGSGGSVSMPSTMSTFEAPRRAGEQRSRAGSGGTSSGDRAVSRGSGGSAPRGGDGSAASAGSSGEPRRAVPAYSRPRDGRPVTGTAVARGTTDPGTGPVVIYRPYYPYYPWYYGGYGYGLGYLFYDPWGYYGGYGWGDPYGYGGYGGYSGGGSGGYSVSRSYKETGNLRLKIDPKKAQIYVDGYYVGVVDSFDGTFQKLPLDAGGHKIELKADGYEPLEFDVLITPGETSTYKGEMKPIK